MGTGKGVQPEATFYEQTMVGGGGSNNYTMATTTTTTPTPRSRWNPTPEQLLALDEIYRRGIRTPSANQIQQMALELLRFGKIEGKNVFYWFQNHRARERQKRRREGENSSKLHKQDAGKKESGIRFSAENVRLQHSKNLVASSQCQRNTEGFSLIQRQASAKGKRITREENQFVNNDTWQNGFFTSPIFHNSFPNTPKFVALDQEQCDYNSNCTLLKNEAREIQTLQLFPLGNNNVDCEGMFKTHKRDKEVAVTTINTKSGPGQFFEFLPMKN